jgi:ATP-dependent protease ClpP protease subunit
MYRKLSLDKRLQLVDKDDLPDIITVQDFTLDSAIRFREEVNNLLNKNDTCLPISITSGGGDVFALISMLDTLQYVKCPIITSVSGQAMSAGIMLSAMGTVGYRYVAPRAQLMMHNMFVFAVGDLPQIVSSVEHKVEMSKLLFKTISRHCGHESDFFSNFLKEKGNVDVFLTAHEAIDLKIADKIGIPCMEISTQLSVNII